MSSVISVTRFVHDAFPPVTARSDTACTGFISDGRSVWFYCVSRVGRERRRIWVFFWTTSCSAVGRLCPRWGVRCLFTRDLLSAPMVTAVTLMQRWD